MPVSLRSTADQPGEARYDGQNLAVRDPDFIRRQLPWLEAVSRLYFRARISGLDQTPRDGQVIFVANHSGGVATPDSVIAAHAFWTRFGVERPIYTLSQPEVFLSPDARKLMRIGCLAATARMAQKVLAAGASLLIYPGAGHEAFRPHSRRHEVDLHDNSAYVRLALRFKAPIVPVVSLGGHDTLIVLDDGRALVEKLGLHHLGVERIPLTWSFPQGLVLGFPQNIPFPARIDVDFGAPITFSGFDAAAARDPEVIAFCHRHIERTMQATLDRLVAARRDTPPPA